MNVCDVFIPNGEVRQETCYDICAMISYNGVTLKINFHRIWFTMEKSFVKWAPGHSSMGAPFAGIMGT